MWLITSDLIQIAYFTYTDAVIIFNLLIIYHLSILFRNKRSLSLLLFWAAGYLCIWGCEEAAAAAARGEASMCPPVVTITAAAPGAASLFIKHMSSSQSGKRILFQDSFTWLGHNSIVCK